MTLTSRRDVGRESPHAQAEDERARGRKANGKGGEKGGGRGGGRGSDLKPLPRPGFDDDERLAVLSDDPRYFEHAELGKAQKAALGIQGLTGRNTASFDPASTLVRPAMRVIYGQLQRRYGKPLKTDDVVAVPNFFQHAEDCDIDDAYRELSSELAALHGRETADPLQSSFCRRARSAMATYFSMEESRTEVGIAWFRDGSDTEPVRFETSKYRDDIAKSRSCAVSVSFGAPREYAFQRIKTDETVYFTLPPGMLFCFGKDVQRRWSHAMATLPQEQRKTAGGHITLTLLGDPSESAEDSVLAPCPSDGPAEVPPSCRDFKAGRCSYGDRCRFSHAEEKADLPAKEKAGQPTDDKSQAVFSGDERPQMRIITVPPSRQYRAPVKHDDVIIVPEFFCAEDDWDIYYQLIKEMRESQAKGSRQAEWISWHEGAHLLSKNPTGSATYNSVLDKMCKYFHIAEGNRGTRFNWYRDGSDWKPFHHDSAAFNWERAQNQNCTVGISFGAARELAFRHAKSGELVYFPQRNGMLFYFGKDANIRWQHGINALPATEQDGKGRISIILWGLCTTTVDEDGSPAMLSDETRPGSYDGRKGSKGGGKGGGGKCRDFARGSCRYGDRCRFSHET